MRAALVTIKINSVGYEIRNFRKLIMTQFSTIATGQLWLECTNSTLHIKDIMLIHIKIYGERERERESERERERFNL